jgi:ribonuclease HI
MAIEENDDTNNPKTRALRELLDEESRIVSLIWIPGHKGVAGNEQVDIEAKSTFEDTLHPTKRIPPRDLSKWLTIKELKNERWTTCNNEMKEKKAKRNGQKIQRD